MGPLVGDAPQLGTLAMKTLQQHAVPEHFAYCPTMDLIALAVLENRVYVYRLNGQRVMGIGNRRAGVQVKKLRWKPNGQLLAVVWSDGTIRLINTDSSRIMHQIEVGPNTTNLVNWDRLSRQQEATCVGWGLTFIESAEIRARVQAAGVSLDDVLGHASIERAQESFADLPKELTLLDIEGTLPKLSPLPSGGKDEDLFGSRASLDSVFRTKEDDGAVDVLIAGFDHGSIHLTIFDSFVIGALDVGICSPKLAGSAILLHASHPYSSTHTLLARSGEIGHRHLFLVPLDLRFIKSSGTYLSLLASKSTQLQNLLRYIGQAQRAMQACWKTAQDLPTKFIRNVDDALQEHSYCDFINAAYHLVVTGDCYAPMKEWLVDELAERGHKRWDKALTYGYENLRQLTHENLLPALERCTYVVSRLRGLSRYQDSNVTLGLSTQALNNVLDVISCLTLLAHNVLKHVGRELRQFSAFSVWLRQEIGVQAADLSSTEEFGDQEATIEHAQVLDYIQGAMTKSRLNDFLLSRSSDEEKRTVGDVPEGVSMYAKYKRDIVNRDGGAQPDQRLLDLRDLTHALEVQSSVVFEQIAEAQKRNVLFGPPIQLGPELDGIPMDMRMLYEENMSMTYIVVRSEIDDAQLRVFRLGHRIQNGVSSPINAGLHVLKLGKGIIMDARFIDDDELMVLWNPEDAHSELQRYRYHTDSNPTPESDSSQHLRYSVHTYGPHATKGSLDELSDASAPSISPAPAVCHVFTSVTFQPLKLEINGRKGRRVVCVLDKEGLQYQVLDLDSGSGALLIEDVGEDLETEDTPMSD